MLVGGCLVVFALLGFADVVSSGILVCFRGGWVIVGLMLSL